MATRTPSLADDYERRANELLQSGQLGHGIQEDLLIASAAWFHQPLLPGAGAFADFFGAAAEHHVTLLSAVDLDPGNRAEAADLHEFLSVILRWIQSMPLAVLGKSPAPLGLVVGWMGTGYNLGAQIMRAGAPAIVYWGVFRSLRKALNDSRYHRLSEQIRQTLVHELIGHQLAFCTAGGPLLSREDLRLIFQACQIAEVKLAGSDSMSVDRFLAEEDLLGAINRIEYYASHRDAQRYHANITERIAFSIQGNLGSATSPYDEILSILKRNLLRAPAPLTPPGRPEGVLYEGYEFSKPDPDRYFVACIGGQWRETEAMERDGSWISQEQLCAASVLAGRIPPPARKIEPDQAFHLNVGPSGYLLLVDGLTLLASPFGLVEEPALWPRPACPDRVETDQASVQAVRNPCGTVESVNLRNRSSAALKFALVPLPPNIQS